MIEATLWLILVVVVVGAAFMGAIAYLIFDAFKDGV